MWRARGELMVRRRYNQRHGHVTFDRLRITGAHRPDRVEVFMLLTPKCCDRVPVLVNGNGESSTARLAPAFTAYSRHGTCSRVQ